MEVKNAGFGSIAAPVRQLVPALKRSGRQREVRSIVPRAEVNDSFLLHAKERLTEFTKYSGDRLHDLEENVHKVEELVGKGLHEAGEGLHDVVHILEDDVHKIEAALEEGLHAVTDNLAEVAHEAEDIVKRGSHALKGALSRQPAVNQTPALALAGASGESVLLQTPVIPDSPVSMPFTAAIAAPTESLADLAAEVAAEEKLLHEEGAAFLEEARELVQEAPSTDIVAIVVEETTVEIRGLGNGISNGIALAASGLAAAETEVQEAAVEAIQAVEEKVQAAKNGMANGRKNVEGSSSNLDVKGEMLEPSLANNKWVRVASIAVAIVAAAGGSSYALKSATPFMHIIAYGIWLGTMVYTTFIAGLTMFKNLPRQTFGKLQAKLFPQYFGLSAACITFTVMTLALGPGLAKQQAIQLGTALALTLANVFYVEPGTSANMFKRYELEAQTPRDEAQIARLKKQFGAWHGISSLLNLGTLVCAVSHGWWLARHIAFPAGTFLTAKSLGL